MGTQWLGGSDAFSLSPANLYWDTASGGANLYVGKTDQWVMRFGVEKTDLVSSQDGAGAADRVVTSDMFELEGGLAQANVERTAALVQGFSVKKNLSGEITGLSFSSSIGERDSSIAKQVTFYNIEGGVIDNTGFNFINVWKVAPAANVEYTYNAGDQRFMQVLFKGYKSSDHLDENGKPTYFGVGVYN